MLAVKSISNLSACFNGSLSNDTKLNLSGDNLIVNDDKINGSLTTFLNADYINDLYARDALIEVSLKETSTSNIRKSYNFKFGEFVKLVALNLAQLNGNQLDAFLTREDASKLYIKSGYDENDNPILDTNNNNAPYSQNVYNRLNFLNENDDKPYDFISIVGGITTTKLSTSDANITSLTATTIDNTSLFSENARISVLDIDTSLCAPTLSVNDDGISAFTISCLTCIADSIKTSNINSKNSDDDNSIISLNADSAIINTDKKFSINGSLELLNNGKIEFKSTNEGANGSIKNSNGTIAISKLKAGDINIDIEQEKNYDLIVGRTYTNNININNNVSANAFIVNNTNGNVKVDQDGFYAPNLTSELTAKAACWS